MDKHLHALLLGAFLAVPVAGEGAETARLRIGDVVASEAEGTWLVPVRLEGTAKQVVSVSYSSASCSAAVGEDFQASAGTLTFPLGDTEASVPIHVFGDHAPEGHELLTVGLSSPQGAVIEDGTGIVTLANDDPPSLALMRSDFDGDGNNDVVFLDPAMRRTGVFLNPSAFADANWRIGSLLDLDADGRVDLLWQHQVSGRLVVWLMNGTIRACGTYLSPDAPEDPAWRIAGPR